MCSTFDPTEKEGGESKCSKCDSKREIMSAECLVIRDKRPRESMSVESLVTGDKRPGEIDGLYDKWPVLANKTTSNPVLVKS